MLIQFKTCTRLFSTAQLSKLQQICELKSSNSTHELHLTGEGFHVSLTLMPFTMVMFSFSSDSKDTRRVLLLAPIAD